MSIQWRRYRQVPIATFTIAYECKDCGALLWHSGLETHDRWHDKVDALAQVDRPVGVARRG